MIESKLYEISLLTLKTSQPQVFLLKEKKNSRVLFWLSETKRVSRKSELKFWFFSLNQFMGFHLSSIFLSVQLDFFKFCSNLALHELFLQFLWIETHIMFFFEIQQGATLFNDIEGSDRIDGNKGLEKSWNFFFKVQGSLIYSRMSLTKRVVFC